MKCIRGLIYLHCLAVFCYVIAACDQYDPNEPHMYPKDSLKLKEAESASKWNLQPSSINYVKPPSHRYPADYNNNAAFIPKRHLLTWLEKPYSEALISWSVDEVDVGNSHYLYVSSTPHFGEDLERNYEIKVQASAKPMAEHCEAIKLMQAKLQNLRPNQTYYYVVVSAGERSKEMHFVTAPLAKNVSFKLLSGGDSRLDGNRKEMNVLMRKMLIDEPDHIALVHGGDFVSDGGSCSDWLGWLEDHQETVDKNGRVLPVIPTFGNHEAHFGGKEIFANLFGNPNIGDKSFYYQSNLGRLSLIILNSEVSVHGKQKQWLAFTLEGLSKEKDQLVIAGYHRAAWSASKWPANTRAFGPLFEKYFVDLVLESDSHTLKQTCPIRAKQCVNKEDGVIYVGDGGLGVTTYRAIFRNAWFFSNGGYAYSSRHVQSIGINGPEKKGLFRVFAEGTYRHQLDLYPRRGKVI